MIKDRMQRADKTPTMINYIIKTSCVILLTLLPGIVSGNTVTLPSTMKVFPGRLVKVVASTDGKQVKWVNGDPDKADLIPSESGLYAIFSSPTEGTYCIYAYTAAVDVPSDAAMCTITVVGVGPPVPPAPPNPPIPPIPPSPPVPPNPPVPPPTDPFVEKLQVAYGSDSDYLKGQHLANLAAIYRQGASIVVSDQSLHTWGDLFDALEKVSNTLGTKGRILNTQKVLAVELSSSLPTGKDKPLDAGGRSLASGVFNKVASALSRVKP